MDLKERLRVARLQKRKIQNEKGPFGYTRRQSLDLIKLNNLIYELKKAIVEQRELNKLLKEKK